MPPPLLRSTHSLAVRRSFFLAVEWMQEVLPRSTRYLAVRQSSFLAVEWMQWREGAEELLSR